MFLKLLSLQNFRNYSKSRFDFSSNTTLVVGPNTSGKTNLIEAIYLLSRGKSFRAEKDMQMIRFGQDLARVKGEIENDDEKVLLEVMLTTGQVNNVETPSKRLLVNGVGKRRIDFATHLPTVLFSPLDLNVIVASPSLRRTFMDDVLEQVDKTYSLALIAYAKGLRQRNALLENVRERGIRNDRQFEYWDKALIDSGNTITKKRETLISFINSAEKYVFDCTVFYDKSIISKERLLQYKEAEIGAGVTLVGPHRDDFSVHMFNNARQTIHDVRFFGSRGQQRLAVLQLKLLELACIEQSLGVRPVLLLDDIFSELDEKHIGIVYDVVEKQQTIITTTHKEFIDKRKLKAVSVVELGQ